jgi:hypothetical protein
MNNNLKTLLAFSAIGMSFAALPAIGGELQPIHVNVPFSFTAGKTNLPAGEYTVYENDSHLVTLRGSKTSVMLLGTAGSYSQDETASSLGFERTSKGFQLRTIKAAGRPASVVPAVASEK